MTATKSSSTNWSESEKTNSDEQFPFRKFFRFEIRVANFCHLTAKLEFSSFFETFMRCLFVDEETLFDDSISTRDDSKLECRFFPSDQ